MPADADMGPHIIINENKCLEILTYESSGFNGLMQFGEGVQ
jgi:hypothetical protein